METKQKLNAMSIEDLEILSDKYWHQRMTIDKILAYKKLDIKN